MRPAKSAKRILLYTYIGTLLLCLGIASRSYAVDFSSVYYLGIEHGMSNNEVNCLYQDRKGFMWFGTFDGLNRYDGYQFKVYRNQINNPKSLINNRIQAITEDSANNLWIATLGGISVYNPLLDEFSSLAFVSSSRKGTTRIENAVSLKADPEGNILIGTVKTGLLIFDRKTGKIVQVPLGIGSRSVSYHVSAIEIDSEKQIWVVVDGLGLCKYSRSTGSLSLVNRSLTSISCLQTDRAGDLWMGTAKGLYKYQPENNMYTHKSSVQAITNLYFDQKGTLWISTDGTGVYLMDISTDKMTHPLRPDGKEVFTSTAIKTVFEDRNKRFWVATLRGGINIIDPDRHQFKTITTGVPDQNGYNNSFISSFCEDERNNIWIGTDGSGLRYWERQLNRFHVFSKEQSRGLRNNNITSITKDYQNVIWVATWGGGIHRYNRLSNSFEHFDCIDPSTKAEFNNTWKLFEDRDLNLWATAYDRGGLFLFNRLSNRFELFDRSLGNILSLEEDSEGRLWVGTDSKLIRVDKARKRHKVFHIGFRVRSLLQYKPSLFWVATEGNGLLLFNEKTGKYLRFTEKDGVPSNAVLNILRDKQGNLWLSTFNGVSKFNPLGRKFESFYATDGLQSNQFSYGGALKLRSGELLFGGIKGFNLFDPTHIGYPDHEQKVILLGMRINDLPITDEKNRLFLREKGPKDGIQELTVPYDKAALSFEYVSIEYSTPDKINYAYQLEGWDRGWTQAGKIRTANYGKLTEGSYLFRIKAANSRGEWGKETVLKVVVLPPWWRSWWAYTGYLVSAAAFLYLYSRYKRKQVRLEYEVQLAQIETRKEKELNEKKLSFFTNITHELRTPLTLIVNPVKELLQKSESSIKDDLNIIYRNAGRLLTLVDQLMLFRRADEEVNKLRLTKLNLYQLCKNTYEFYIQAASSRNIQYDFIFENTQLEVLGDYDKLETALFNILSNAFKFTPDKGSISLRVVENQENVDLMIIDSGCGINESAGSKLFEKYYRGQENTGNKEIGFGIGLYLAKSFIDAHQGSLDFTSAEDKGTSFCISLKKGNWCEMAETSAATPAASANRAMPIPKDRQSELPDTSTFEITAKKSMVVADDNAELRHYLKTVLSDKFVVHEAEDAIQAFKMAQEHMPDLVISDILMNSTDGVELCKRLKSDTQLNHIPVILLSGLSSSESRLKGIEGGADDYITKPFDTELLVAKVDSVLKNRETLQQYFRDSITLTENNQKISAEYKAFLEKCVAVVEANLDNENFNAKMLAEACNMGYSNFYKKVKTISGQSVSAFVRSIRLRKAAVLMLSSDTNINEAAFQAGIYDIKYFRIQFKKLYGLNPSEYIKKYRHSFNKEFNLIKKY